MQRGWLDPSVEKIIIADQANGLRTNKFRKMVGISNNDWGRFLSEADESVSHLELECKILLADKWYTKQDLPITPLDD